MGDKNMSTVRYSEVPDGATFYVYGHMYVKKYGNTAWCVGLNDYVRCEKDDWVDIEVHDKVSAPADVGVLTAFKNKITTAWYGRARK